MLVFSIDFKNYLFIFRLIKLLNKKLLIYGANGYTGKLIVDESIRSGLKPIIAGRNKKEIEALSFEKTLEYRIFSIDELDSGLNGIDIVINCAGPFVFTIDKFIKACLKKKVHYFDITGEIEVFEKAFSYDAEAKERGIVICSGIGFDVVPTDCLALMLKERLNEQATNLDIAFHTQGGISKGTRKTALLGGGSGPKIRREGIIKSVAYGEIQKEIKFPHKDLICTAISWGDVVTAYISTNIPNITVYIPIHPKLLKKMKKYGKFSFLLRSTIIRSISKKLIFKKQENRIDGPTEETRENTKSYIWGKIEGNGKSKESMLITPNGYTLTALTTVIGIKKFIDLNVQGGFYTPSKLFGSKFILEIPGVELVS